MNHKEYHNDTSRISKSGLDLINKCPKLYEHRYLLGNESKQTEALVFGSALHCYVLTNELFSSEYIVMPKFSGKGSVEKSEEFRKLNIHKQIITTDQYSKILGMNESLMSNTSIRNLLTERGFSERAMYWTDEDTGVKCRLMVDRYNEDRKLIVDIKTTEDASVKGFSRSAKKYRYHVQSPMYLDGFKANGYSVNGFIFIAIEKSPPYLSNVLFYSDDNEEIGRLEYRKNLETYKKCLDTGFWPAYEGISEIELW